MLRIGKLTDYAMLIMSQVAKQPGMVLSAALLAGTLQLKVPTISKILKILAEKGLLNSVRGAEGGYRLAKSAETITLADIITAMEGAPAMTLCCGTKLCALDAVCTMRENWRRVNGAIQSLLTGVTVKDMLSPLSFSQVLQGLTHGE